MFPTIPLSTRFRSLRLSLQSPALTTVNGRHHAMAIPTRKGSVIHWRAVAGPVVLTGECRPAAAGHWEMDFTITNRGPDTEVRFAYPYLFYRFEQKQLPRIFDPGFGGVLELQRTFFDMFYPGPATFCLTAAAGLEATVASGCFDDDQRKILIRHIPTALDGQIRFLLERALVRHGETLRVPRQFIAVGANWWEAFRPYLDWHARTFGAYVERPAWYATEPWTMSRRAHCLAPMHAPDAMPGVWIFADTARRRTFAEIKREVDTAATEGKAHGYQSVFYQFGWWESMATLRGLFCFDTLCGDYFKAHPLTKRVVDYVHSKGLRTYLYTNVISIGDETATYRDAPGLMVRDAAGFPIYNAGYPMLMLCPSAPGIREYWTKTLRYILRDLDADGIFLDQVGGGFQQPACYAPDHRHDHPDCYGRDFLELTRFIRDTAKALKPDAYVGGELVLDSRSTLLDEAHGPGYNTARARPPATRTAQRRTPPAEQYIFTRYLAPNIYSSLAKSGVTIMDGAAGEHADPVWRKHRPVFESTVTPCVVQPCGGLAYLFGPSAGRYVLAVRSHGNIGRVRITLPAGTPLPDKLPTGLRSSRGDVVCTARPQPRYFTWEE